MDGIIGRFLSFDKLIGATLIKVLYYIGLASIGLFAVISLIGALSQVTNSPMATLGGIVVIPVITLISIIFWRFMCELYMILFRMSDDLKAVRGSLGAGGDKTESN